MMADLKGKAGIVTGGSSGIGFQIANVLAEAGATVYVISRTGRPKEGVGESASGVVHLKGDVGDVEAMKAMAAELAAKTRTDMGTAQTSGGRNGKRRKQV